MALNPENNLLRFTYIYKILKHEITRIKTYEKIQYLSNSYSKRTN